MSKETQGQTIEIDNRQKVSFKLADGHLIECCIRDGKLRIESERGQITITPAASNLIYVE